MNKTLQSQGHSGGETYSKARTSREWGIRTRVASLLPQTDSLQQIIEARLRVQIFKLGINLKDTK